MANGERRWLNMAEMSMTTPDGNEFTFERDGTVSVSGINTLCDRCDQYAPTTNGQNISDSSGQVIMWFCFKCRLQAYIK